MAAMALYYAFIEDHEIVVCILVFQEMREGPRNMQYPVTNLLVVGPLPKSASL